MPRYLCIFQHEMQEQFSEIFDYRYVRVFWIFKINVKQLNFFSSRSLKKFYKIPIKLKRERENFKNNIYKIQKKNENVSKYFIPVKVRHGEKL